MRDRKGFIEIEYIRDCCLKFVVWALFLVQDQLRQQEVRQNREEVVPRREVLGSLSQLE